MIGANPIAIGASSTKLPVDWVFLIIASCPGPSHVSHTQRFKPMALGLAMAHETDLESKRGRGLTDIAIVIGAALLGSGVLFAVLSVASLHVWR
jgi:hypothetical protein